MNMYSFPEINSSFFFHTLRYGILMKKSNNHHVLFFGGGGEKVIYNNLCIRQKKL